MDSYLRSRWDFEELLLTGDQYFDSLERGICDAEKSIELESYIYADDALGKRITERLIQAHQRGVVVRLIVDGIGSWGWIHTQGAQLNAAGIPFRVYHQLPWERLNLAHRTGLLEPPWTKRLGAINRRNHRKLCVIDGRRAWVGSFNISGVHLQSLRGENAWRDLGIKVEGNDVEYLRAAFESLWHLPTPQSIGLLSRTRRQLKKSLGSGVRLNATGWLRRRNYRTLLKAIHAAQKRIWIYNAYFVPTGSLLRALRAAAARGVDVRLMLSSKSDVFFMPWVASAFYEGLIQAGVQLFDYTPSMLHAKAVLFDHSLIVGSTNLNQRSLKHDLEVDLVSDNPASISILEQAYLQDVARACPLSSSPYGRYSLWEKIVVQLALVFKYWL